MCVEHVLSVENYDVMLVAILLVSQTPAHKIQLWCPTAIDNTLPLKGRPNMKHFHYRRSRQDVRSALTLLKKRRFVLVCNALV